MVKAPPRRPVALCPPVPDGHRSGSAPEPTPRGARGAEGEDGAADGRGAAHVSPQGKPDLNTALPVRQTASIFKQPVTKITNHPSNKVKSDPQKAVEQPRQVSAGPRSAQNRVLWAAESLAPADSRRALGRRVLEQVVVPCGVLWDTPPAACPREFPGARWAGMGPVRMDGVSDMLGSRPAQNRG